MPNRLFQKYLDKAKDAEVEIGTKESIDWFRKVVTKNGQISNLTKITEGYSTAKLRPGEMITYGYDPKLKERLDFYDEHPLVIFLEKTANGWYGINLHYLPPVLRAKLLHEYNYSDTKGLRFAQQLIKDQRTNFCLKRYLVTHTMSKPVSIPKDVWEIAIALPFDKFLKESKKKVWQIGKKNGRNR